MKTTSVSNKEMLEICNKKDKIKDIKQISFFTLFEHDGQKLFIEGNAHENAKTVVIVEKNSDFTEGRGPMHFHKVFKKVENAINYIMSQSGIYGSQQGTNNYAGVSIHGKAYVVSGFSGYKIKVVTMEDEDSE